MSDNIRGYRIMVKVDRTGEVSDGWNVDYLTSQRYGAHGEMGARFAADRMCEYMNDTLGDTLTFSVATLYRPSIGPGGLHRSDCLCPACEARRDSIGGIPATPHGTE